MRSKQVPSAFLRIAVILAVALVLMPPALAQTKFKVLYTFKGPPDAAAPYAGVIFDGNGNLYGTTAGGGTGKCGLGCGTVYELKRQSSGRWTEEVLHSFQNSDGGVFGGLVADPLGNMYGIADGANGPLFELTPSGQVKLYALPDGGSRWSLFRDRAGNLFGLGAGGVFELTRSSQGWKQKVLYFFQCGGDGCDPVGSLIPDAKGNLYGATEFGGNFRPACTSSSGGCGTVYEVTQEADGKWRENVLHRFAQFKDDGQIPMAGPVMDSQGNLYGTTIQGGSVRNNGLCLEGCGIVYKLTPGLHGTWKESILYNFCHAKDCTDGAGGGALVFDRAGNLYGISAGGIGPCNGGCGVVFKLSPGANGKWTHHVLHRFSGPDGGDPLPLTMDNEGHLYGTTFWGGKYLYGVVYEITP
ncbi:MAG TPA: choice-of-anchor tandem repeat GloVer-containing protein [Terriglobales bacterium]|nr:choice-of-anchor tandem repeat GloVer-containing protein [Terriglobales bacterium]